MSDLGINNFKSFIQESVVLLRNHPNGIKSNNNASIDQRANVISNEIEQFSTFIDFSIPLIIDPIKKEISFLKNHVSLIKQWHIPFDILDIANLTKIEDSYTNIIAWALDPTTHQPSALIRQKTWLNSLGISYDFDKPCKPETFVYTTDGIPDLVLEYANSIIIIEAKTESREHTTPSGLPQTKAYLEAIKKDNPSKKVIVVFLTIDGHHAQNKEAINTTYFHFACSLAEALRNIELSTDLKWAFSTIITHFINNLTPLEIDTTNLMLKIDDWCKNLDDPFNIKNRSYLARNINEIAPYLTLIKRSN